MGKISARQLMLIVALSRTAVMIIFLPVITQGLALQDAWIAALLAGGAGMLLVLLPTSLMMRFPGRSFAVIARESLGNVLGITLALIVGLFYLALAALRARQLALLIFTTIMPVVPGWAISITVLLTALYGAILGADTLGRAAESIALVMGFAFAAGFILVFSVAVESTSLIRPILARGLDPLVVAAINPTFWFLTSGATVLALGKYVNDPKGMRRAVVLATLASSILLSFSAFTVTITLGAHQASAQLSPLLSVAKSVFIFGVVERLDILLVAMWVFGVAFDVTLFLWVASVLIGDGLGVKPSSAVIVLASIVAVLSSLQSTDVFNIHVLLGPAPTGIALLGMVGIIGFVYLIALLRKKGQ